MTLVQDPVTTSAALNAVAQALQIAETRAVRDAPNGFTWWMAPGLRQRVRVEVGPPDGTLWLRIETPVWSGADTQAIAPLLAALGQHARGAAVVHAPASGDVALVTRAPLPSHLLEARATALAGTGAIQAFLAAWAWGEARTQFGPRASWWRDALPHPDLGMDVPPDAVFAYRERVLRPQGEARAGAFAQKLLVDTTEAIEQSGLGLMPRRADDGRKVTFAVDLGPTAGFLEVGLIKGAVDAHALCVAVSLPGHLTEERAHACAFELLRRQLVPGAETWTVGSWMPLASRDGRPGFGLTHGLFVPLALAEPDLGREIAGAVARTVDLVQAWFEAGAPAPVPLSELENHVPGQRLVA
jgi:hypothetical protein